MPTGPADVAKWRMARVIVGNFHDRVVEYLALVASPDSLQLRMSLGGEDLSPAEAMPVAEPRACLRRSRRGGLQCEDRPRALPDPRNHRRPACAG